MDTHPPRPEPLALALLVTGTMVGLAGTDLVLPAVPSLPDALGGNAATAQFVLAAFVSGSAVGLLGFGALGGHFDQRRLLAASLAGYALLSAAAALAPTLETLVAIRFAQGFAGSAAAVFAPHSSARCFRLTGPCAPWACSAASRP